MFKTTSRGRHGAPRRAWLRQSRPACGQIPELPVADAVPSMELPEGHMAQRPQEPDSVYVGTVLAKQRSKYRTDDVVKVTGGLVHVGRRGIVAVAYGGGRPLVVEIDGGQVYLDEDDVRLVRRPSDEDTEQFATVHVSVPVSVVEVEHVGGASIGFWTAPAADAADTLVMDVVDGKPSDAELARYYADIMAEDAAQPSTSMEDKLAYAAQCAASGNPLMQFEREIMGLPLDADDVPLMGGAAR